MEPTPTQGKGKFIFCEGWDSGTRLASYHSQKNKSNLIQETKDFLISCIYSILVRESDSFGLAIEYRTIFVYFHEDFYQKHRLYSASIPIADVKGRILLFQERISTLPAEVGLKWG